MDSYDLFAPKQTMQNIKCAYEVYRQNGYITTMLFNGQSINKITSDYTGIALRDQQKGYERMICVSGASEYNIGRLKNLLQLCEGSTHIADVEQLPPLKQPLLESDSKELFGETKKAVEGHNITVTLSHLKNQSVLSPFNEPSNQLKKSQEFILLALEGNDNPDESRCLLGVYPNARCVTTAQIEAARDWQLQRRKLTKPFAAGKYPLVFAPGIGGILIHEVIGHQFELSKSFSAHSPTKYRRGYKLFSDNLTVVDAPLSLMPTQNFDDEGTTKKETVLIKDGAIISPLTDMHSIYTYPDYPLTGNCRRESYLHYPTSRLFNTYVKNGADSASQAINNIKHGFYVEEISYAVCHHRTGAVLICASKAKVIRRGKITDTPATFYIDDIASSFFDVKFICDDLLLLPGFCHASSGGLYMEHGSPTIGFDNISLRNGFVYKTR